MGEHHAHSKKKNNVYLTGHLSFKLHMSEHRELLALYGGVLNDFKLGNTDSTL